MKFGTVDVKDSPGAIVAHTVRQNGLVLKKGHVVTGEDAATMEKAGIASLVVARLEEGDIGEDRAAGLLAEALAGANIRVDKPFTGRSNLFATADGVLCIDPESIDAINMIDASVTVATLERWRRVVDGEMIGTVKIIPFAVAGEVAGRAAEVARQSPLRVAPFRPMRVGVVSTILPGLKKSVVDKTLRVLGERLEPARAQVVADERVEHEAGALAGVIETIAQQSDIVVVFGASAITDRRDVIPAALEAAGGEIEHFGMPVDPGNLLLVGRLADGARRVHVLGAPGCARSPKENGFDWVLYRLLANIPVTAADIRKMGVGGLLMEIVQRGQLRDTPAPETEDA
ncbi:MAG: molybdopterin-binding protein [Beijerinckiaceae bacterium]